MARSRAPPVLYIYVLTLHHTTILSYLLSSYLKNHRAGSIFKSSSPAKNLKETILNSSYILHSWYQTALFLFWIIPQETENTSL
ncbi:hypothetical protein Y1Q_0007966 [Alligator mississippiensis]|uniref:Uncharacterized protein n=1 Tax=Alligator mississippiensis TaxID=8496 RepID=A0A151NF05_ALLMI|nr:hypothetical protein Y1Q_0007966 [Alligator mississippiensis]